MNKRLKKLIFDKVDDDLENILFLPYRDELWLIDEEKKNWFFVANSNGNLCFNRKNFDSIFALFSMRVKEYSDLLKEWFEYKTKIPIRSISRKNTDYEYIVEGLLGNSRKKVDWTLKNRHGFSYILIKKYIDTKKNKKTEKLYMKDLIWD